MIGYKILSLPLLANPEVFPQELKPLIPYFSARFYRLQWPMTLYNLCSFLCTLAPYTLFMQVFLLIVTTFLQQIYYIKKNPS